MKETYSTIEEQAWDAYPSRGEHSNPKREAIQKFRATLRRGAIAFDVLAGIRRYAKYCERRGITGTDKVMQARRFFGKEEEWKLPWDGQPLAPHTGITGANQDFKYIAGVIEGRKQRRDGDLWWETIQQEWQLAGQEFGYHNHRDFLLFAYAHI